MDVSIIIVNYNTFNLTTECISSIIQYTREVLFEIIVVDNGSSDESKRHFEHDGRIKYIYSENNLGFGGANNLGAKYAHGKYLFFLNSDTLLKNNALKYFLEYFECTENVGALGGILYDTNRNPIHSFGKFITLSREFKYSLIKYCEKLHFIKRDKFKFAKFKFPLEVEYITGADLFMRKETFINIGGFDTHFFMYCEEVDLQERLSKLQLKRIIIPGPVIVHLEGASDDFKVKKWSTKRYHNTFLSKNYYIKKRYNKLSYITYIIINTLLSIPGIIIRPDSIKNKFKILSGILDFSQPIK